MAAASLGLLSAGLAAASPAILLTPAHGPTTRPNVGRVIVGVHAER